MKIFNYKNQTFTCETIHKNTNPTLKSKCFRIINEAGVRNLYTIADGYTKAVAYDKNKIVLSDIVVGKALSILGLMTGNKFVFADNTPTTAKSSVAITVPSINSMYRVIDVNTGSIAMFSSEIDVVSYCIGRTVKVDKIEISTGLTDTNITADIPDIDVVETPIAPIVEEDIPAPKRRVKSDYTTTNSKSETPIDIPIDIPIEDKPKPRRRGKA